MKKTANARGRSPGQVDDARRLHSPLARAFRTSTLPSSGDPRTRSPGHAVVLVRDGVCAQPLRTGLFIAGQRVAALPLHTALTPADRLGRWPGAFIDSAAVVLLVAAQIDALRRRRAGGAVTGGRGPGPSPVV